MKILSATIRWSEHCSNSPDVEIEVDELPTPNTFEKIEDGLEGHIYLAEKDGLVRFYSYSGPSTGFGGMPIPLVLTDGTEETLIGPWSSRPGVINSLQEDIQCADACTQHYCIALTLDKMIEACKLAGCHLVKVTKWEGEVYYYPSFTPDKVSKPSGFTCYETDPKNDVLCETIL